MADAFMAAHYYVRASRPPFVDEKKV